MRDGEGARPWGGGGAQWEGAGLLRQRDGRGGISVVGAAKGVVLVGGVSARGRGLLWRARFSIGGRGGGRGSGGRVS